MAEISPRPAGGSVRVKGDALPGQEAAWKTAELKVTAGGGEVKSSQSGAVDAPETFDSGNIHIKLVYPADADAKERQRLYTKLKESVDYLNHSAAFREGMESIRNSGRQQTLEFVHPMPGQDDKKMMSGSVGHSKTRVDGNKIFWNPDEGTGAENGMMLSPAATLGHEWAGHGAFNLDQRTAWNKSHPLSSADQAAGFTNPDEVRTFEFERRMVNELNEWRRSQGLPPEPLRYGYGFQGFQLAPEVTSTK